MTREQFLKERKGLLAEQDKLKAEINKLYSKKVKEFTDANCPYKLEQVVLIGEGKRAKRMVIFQIEPLILDTLVLIQLYGWYLDKENNCTKWEGSGINVFGVSNPAKVELSVNQEWNPIKE